MSRLQQPGFDDPLLVLVHPLSWTNRSESTHSLSVDAVAGTAVTVTVGADASTALANSK